MLIASEIKSVQECVVERQYTIFDLLGLIACILAGAFVIVEALEIKIKYYESKKSKLNYKTTKLNFRKLKKEGKLNGRR